MEVDDSARVFPAALAVLTILVFTFEVDIMKRVGHCGPTSSGRGQRGGARRHSGGMPTKSVGAVAWPYRGRSRRMLRSRSLTVGNIWSVSPFHERISCLLSFFVHDNNLAWKVNEEGGGEVWLLTLDSAHERDILVLEYEHAWHDDEDDNSGESGKHQCDLVEESMLGRNGILIATDEVSGLVVKSERHDREMQSGIGNKRYR